MTQTPLVEKLGGIVAVVALVERGGRVRAFPMEKVTAANVHEAIVANVGSDAQREEALNAVGVRRAACPTASNHEDSIAVKPLVLPMPFEEALSDLLKVKPPEKGEKKPGPKRKRKAAKKAR